MSDLKFVVIGTTQIVLDYAKTLLDCGASISGMVCLPQNELPLNSVDIAGYCLEKKIPYAEFSNINEVEPVKWIRGHAPDYILSAWPFILQGDIFEAAPGGIIGSHPTELPYNRGRHPLHWLIALGIPYSKMSFFRMDAGVDSGDILHQEPFEVGREHLAVVLERMNEAACNGLKALYSRFASGNSATVKQDHSQANYWRMRTPHDSMIDPRLSRSAIDRIVRSFSLPYPCATLWIGDTEYRICDCCKVDAVDPERVKRMEPGRVYAVDGKHLTLKVDDGLIRLISVEDFDTSVERIKHIFPPTYYLT